MRIPVAVKFGNGEQTLNIEAVNVPNSDGQLYIMAQPTGNFTVLLYDYTSKETLYEATVEYGDDIEFEIECPSNADITHQLQLLFYTGEKGKTAYINSIYKDVKVEDITNKEDIKVVYTKNEIEIDDNNDSGTALNYNYRRVALLDNKIDNPNLILPGNRYRITMSSAAYEVKDLVDTYMQFKVTDCSESIEDGSSTPNTTNITFFIKEIWSNDLGETKEYSYKSKTFENITVYNYTKLGTNHKFTYIKASELVDTILELQKNISIDIDYNNISYNGTTRTLTEELGYNLEAIYVTASVTKLGNPPSIPLRDNENRDNFNLDIYSYGYGPLLGSQFKIDGSWHAKILVNVRKGSSNDYFVMQATSDTANFYACLNSSELGYNVSGSSSSSMREVYNASYIFNYKGAEKYNFLKLTGDSELKVDLDGVGGFEGNVALFHIIGDIQKVDDNPLETPILDKKNNVYYWKLNSEPSSVSYKIGKIGNGTSNFFKDYYVPNYLYITDISIAKNTFNNLNSTTRYYVPGYNFNNGTKVNSDDELFNTNEVPYSFAVDVSPFNPGITPKSYEMNMYKPFYDKQIIQNLTAGEDEPNKFLTISQRVTPGDKFLIKIDKVSVNSNSVNKDIKQFTTLIYRTTNTERPSWYGEDIARVDMDLGEDLCYSIECPSDVSDEYPIWLLIYDGIRGKCNNNSIDFKNITVSNLYTIEDYYSYDRYQIGKDSYGRGE